MLLVVGGCCYVVLYVQNIHSRYLETAVELPLIKLRTTPCIGREDLLRSDPVEKVTSPVSELAVERAASSPDFIPR